MLYLGLLFLGYLIASLWYIRKLHRNIRAHEQRWVQIEKLTDHNVQGDIVIHTTRIH